MEHYAFEIIGSRRLETGEEPIPLTVGLQAQLEEALAAEAWEIAWKTNFDRAAVGHCLFPIRTAPVSLMQQVEQLSPLYLLGMPWGTALYLDEATRVIHYIISSPAALLEVFFSDLPEEERRELEQSLERAADVLRRLAGDIVGTPVEPRDKGYRFPEKRQPAKEFYADILFERSLRSGESPKEAVEEVAEKMHAGLENTFYWHVSGTAPVSDTATIVMSCQPLYAHLAMEMGTYHCPALPCTAVAYAKGDRVTGAMLKPIHMFKTFFADVPWWIAVKYVKFPFSVHREIRDCLCRYLECR